MLTQVLAKLKRPVTAQFAGAAAGCLRGDISKELAVGGEYGGGGGQCHAR
jgi:hypothetical protein